MAGKLYVVGTPIGNMSDMSPRAVETLAKVDFIAAEDTRVSAKLLTHFGIKKPMISYHKFSAEQREQDIIDRIMDGESCAVITDAGMPCISDPGEQLVKQCRDCGIEIESVPGPSALITALSVSGMDTARFSFEGFLSVTKKQRDKHLKEIKDMPHTLIFYEAPHKLKNTLRDLLDALGDRPAALCRELTKLHEEVMRSTLSELNAYYEENTPRGEYVIVVQGNYKSADTEEMTLAEAAQKAAELAAGGMKPAEACRQAALNTSYKKSEVYKEYLKTYNT
ncbi:MAG: 16S rRNA (cytidine(1402)-2'-O)-methyltransferase [Eubacterium sp.]|nr:16S rRNA (cytidine(1402)-2'-O)-methyltransferase [Eubacterium sp.]